MNPDCCEAFETNWLTIIPKRFLPGPAIYKYGKRGLEIVEPSEYFKDQLNFSNQNKYKFATLQERLMTNLVSKEASQSKSGIPRPPPFDSYCPSMDSKLDECVCKTCGSCWPCAAARKRHEKAHPKKSQIEPNKEIPFSRIIDEFDSEEDAMEVENVVDNYLDEPMPIFSNIIEHLNSPFEQLGDEFLD